MPHIHSSYNFENRLNTSALITLIFIRSIVVVIDLYYLHLFAPIIFAFIRFTASIVMSLYHLFQRLNLGEWILRESVIK